MNERRTVSLTRVGHPTLRGVEVRISFTDTSERDALKAAGFTWDAMSKCWSPAGVTKISAQRGGYTPERIREVVGELVLRGYVVAGAGSKNDIVYSVAEAGALDAGWPLATVDGPFTPTEQQIALAQDDLRRAEARRARQSAAQS